MASIFKRPNSPYWFASYRGPRNERVKKSTKKTNKNDALDIALKWQSLAKEARDRTLTETQARKVVAEIALIGLGKPLKFYTCREWLEKWLAGKKPTQAKATYLAYRNTVTQFLKHLGARADLTIEAIAPEDIQGFRDSQNARGLAPKTCNSKVKFLSIGFNAARKQGIIVHNPCEAVDPLPAEENEKFRKPFTGGQLAKVLEVAPGDWKGAILIAAFTGARIGDVTQMKWESIDLMGKTVSFVPEKTRRTLPGHRPKSVSIPMHPQLEDFLLSLPSPKSKTSKVSVFPKLAKQKVGGLFGLSNTFAGLLEEAGIKRQLVRKSKGESGRKVFDLGFHSLRHFFNSSMANHGVSQEIRQQFTGHSSADMNDIYTHLDPETLRRSIEALPSIRQD